MEALRAAGFEVITNLDSSVADMTVVETGRIERETARAIALAAKAERRHAAENAAWDAVERQAAIMPPLGEPIKIGHHSEGRHRKAFEDMHRKTRKWVDACEASGEADHRADVAAHATEHRYDPVTVANRIDKLEADLRRIDRKLAGYERWVGLYTPGVKPRLETVKPEGEYLERLTTYRAETLAQLEYWRSVRETQKAEGVRSFGPGDVAKGDLVRDRYGWHEVVRVNRKTVSVKTDYSWTETLPWVGILDVKRRSVS